MNTDEARRLARPGRWFRYAMPYCFAKLDLGSRRHVYLPLNRQYKPLGISSSAWVTYEDYSNQAAVFPVDPHTFNDVWHNPDGLYLYADAPASRRGYFERLERLMVRSVRYLGAVR